METKSIEELIRELKEITTDCIKGDLSLNDLPGYVMGYLDTINNEILQIKDIVSDLIKTNIAQAKTIADNQQMLDYYKGQVERDNEHINSLITILESLK